MKKIEDIDKVITYLKEYANALNELQAMSPKEQEMLEKKYQDFIKINSSKESTLKKGKALEKLVETMLNSTHLFDIKTNIRTTTNEIDDVVIANTTAEILINNGILNKMYSLFLGECKDYKRTIPVTFVGKFYSLMNTSSIKLGIMFSAKGISGKGEWSDGKGLCKKIYMSREKENEKIHILDFNINDFKRIISGETFTSLVKEKVLELQLSTSFNSLITHHAAEGKI